MSVRVIEGDALTMLRTLESESVQCCVTSPPYFQLRDYGVAEQIGMEQTPAEFIAALVGVFDDVKRVLRPDGLCFVNLGDSYAGSGKGPTGANGIGDQEQRQGFTGPSAKSTLNHGRGVRDDQKSGAQVLGGGVGVAGIPAKNLLLIPERFAIAMQDAGWWVRSRIAWCKTSAMPESVRDRPTSAWEHVWMFSKSACYFYDADAVRQRMAESTANDPRQQSDAFEATRVRNRGGRTDGYTSTVGLVKTPDGGANLRNYWLLSPEPSREEHYASFPTAIPKRCILAGTSEKGACPSCGAPWTRVVERERGTPGEVRGYQAGVAGTTPSVKHGKGSPNAVIGANYMQMTARGGVKSETLGWTQSCPCPPAPPTPQTVLDPFAGSGTTGMVADRLGRDAVLIELSPVYSAMARRRITNDSPMFAEVVAS